MELKTLLATFVSDANLDMPLHLDEQTRTLWARRYADAVERIRRAGIKTTESGAEHYISLRAKWDRYITLLAPKFAYEMDEIDTALAKVK